MSAGSATVPSNADFDLLRRVVGGDQSVIDGLVKKINDRNINPFNLDMAERLSIWIYTSTDQGWYSNINNALRGLPSKDMVDFASLLNRAIAKLPSRTGKAYRGIDVSDPSMFVLNYVRNKEFPWSAFTSSSSERSQAFDGNILFIISSKNGKVLGPYADKISEQEILFKAGARFAMTHVEPIDSDYIILLDEVV